MRRNIYIKMTAALLLTGMVLTGCGNNNPNEDKELAYRKAGIQYMEDGDYEAALTAFQNALDQSNGRITDLELDICFYKAKTQMLSGDTKAAMTTYNAILNYDEDNAESYYLRGVLYLENGKADQALKDFDKAVKLRPADYELYIAIYDNLKAVDMEKDGAAYLKKALNIDGTEAEDYCGRGRVYFLLEDYENARLNLDKAINKGSEQAKLYMAEYLEAIGEEDSAYAVYESYAKRHEKDAEAQSRLAKILMEQGKYEKALEYLKKSLETGDADYEEETNKMMILVYEAMGDFSTAFELAGEYLEKNPNDAQMQREYEFLRTRK